MVDNLFGISHLQFGKYVVFFDKLNVADYLLLLAFIA